MRYHFHIDDGVPNNDVDSTEMESLEDAEDEICRLVGTMLSDDGRAFWRNPNWRIRVTDETGTPVLAIMVMGVRGSLSNAE